MRRLAVFVSLTACLLLLTGCDIFTSSSESLPKVTYSGEVTTVQANDAGKAQINSNITSQGTQYDLTIDVTASDRDGNPIPNAKIQYGQINGKSFLMVRGPNKNRVPFTFFGTPKEMVDKFSGSIKGESSSNTSYDKSKNLGVVASVSFVATVLTTEYAVYKFFTNAYRVEKFYLTDQVEGGEDYKSYCKTFSEIAGLINARLSTKLTGASIALNFVTAGTGALSGGTLTKSSLMLDAGLAGTEALRDAVLERAVEVWGEQSDAVNGNKPVEVRVYFAEGDGASTKIKNLYARFDIIRNSPKCGASGLVKKIGTYGGHEYYVSKPDVRRNWNEARNVADRISGHLATISDKEEEKFVINNIKNINNRVGWTGLTDRKKEGNFKWVTGEEVTYTNWCDGEPNDIGTEDAVVIRFDTKCWNDADIVNDDRGFVIEVE